MPACDRAWNSPVTTPTNRAMSAIRRYAPAKRRSVLKVCSFPASCAMRASVDVVGSRPGFDNDLAPHGVVGQAAIFVTQEGVSADSVETGRDPGHLPGQQHSVDIGGAYQEAVD